MPQEVERNRIAGQSTEQNAYFGVYRILVGGMVASTILFAIGTIRALMHPTFYPLTPESVRL